MKFKKPIYCSKCGGSMEYFEIMNDCPCCDNDEWLDELPEDFDHETARKYWE